MSVSRFARQLNAASARRAERSALGLPDPIITTRYISGPMGVRCVGQFHPPHGVNQEYVYAAPSTEFTVSRIV